MSGVNDWSRAERDLYAVGSRALLDELERKRQEWRESWALDSTSTGDMIREHNARMRELEEQHRAWLSGYLKDASGEADEPAPTQNVAGAEGATVPAGHRPPQPNPHAAELAEAERIRNLSLQDFAVERERLIRSRTSRGMFG